MIEDLKNKQWRQIENYAIQFQTGTSYSALELAIHNLSQIGEVQKVVIKELQPSCWGF